jgi:DNA-binding transcriptional ArsR family regulator
MTDDELINAWRSSTNAAQLAAQLGMPPKVLRAHWRRLKEAGVLPMVARPVGEQRHREAWVADGRPTVGQDTLLERLLRHHRGSE